MRYAFVGSLVLLAAWNFWLYATEGHWHSIAAGVICACAAAFIVGGEAARA